MPSKRHRGGKRRSSRNRQEWSSTTRGGELVTLTGYLIDLIEEEDGGDGNDDAGDREEEEEEEFEDCDMQDQCAILQGAADGRKRLCPTRKCYMHVKTSNGTSLVKVRGKFILDGPWWCITFEAFKERIRGEDIYSIKSACSNPVYSLRNEDEMESLITLLVSRVFSNPPQGTAEDQMRASFLDYLRRSNSLRSFVAFFKAVEAAQKQENEPELCSLAGFVMKRFLKIPAVDDGCNSREGEKKKQPDDLRPIYRCFKFPELFRVLPRLMERRAYSMLTTEDIDNLEVLDTVLRDSPEDFGFETTMRDHGWRLVEAQYQGFVNAAIVPRLPEKMLLALQYYNIVKEKCDREGHTFIRHLTADNVYTKRKYGVQPPKEKERVLALGELQRRNVIEVIHHDWHWVKYRSSERSIARALSHLVRYHREQPYVIPEGDDSNCNFDPLQQRAARSIRDNPFSCILGKGGCGKTHVACSVLRQLPKRWAPEMEERSDDERELMTKKNKRDKKEDPVEQPIVLLTAPTGRAASILSRRTGMEARTLQSVMWTESRSDPSPDKFPYARVKVLVVDECSMVPVRVLARVLWCLLGYSLRKVIFLGDEHQLPSVQPGNFLQDVVKALGRSHYITRLTTNHRSDAGGRLIVENAEGIAERNQEYPRFEIGKFELVELHSTFREEDVDSVIRQLVTSRKELQDPKRSQIVAFVGKCVKCINETCCQCYANHRTFDSRGQSMYQLKDKICAKRNTAVRELYGGTQNAVERRVNNGDIFFIKDLKTVVESDGKRKEVATLLSMDDDDDETFVVDFGHMKRKAKVQFAWARTIHTFQGSETDYVVYVLSDCCHENWTHFYTAITRGRKGCYVVGNESLLRRVLREQPRPRNTSLRDFLSELLTQLQPPQRRYPSPLAKSVSSCNAQNKTLRTRGEVVMKAPPGKNQVSGDSPITSNRGLMRAVAVPSCSSATSGFLKPKTIADTKAGDLDQRSSSSTWKPMAPGTDQHLYLGKGKATSLNSGAGCERPKTPAVPGSSGPSSVGSLMPSSTLCAPSSPSSMIHPGAPGGNPGSLTTSPMSAVQCPVPPPVTLTSVGEATDVKAGVQGRRTRLSRKRRQNSAYLALNNQSHVVQINAHRAKRGLFEDAASNPPGKPLREKNVQEPWSSTAGNPNPGLTAEGINAHADWSLHSKRMPNPIHRASGLTENKSMQENGSSLHGSLESNPGPEQENTAQQAMPSLYTLPKPNTASRFSRGRSVQKPACSLPQSPSTSNPWPALEDDDEQGERILPVKPIQALSSRLSRKKRCGEKSRISPSCISGSGLAQENGAERTEKSLGDEPSNGGKEDLGWFESDSDYELSESLLQPPMTSQ